MINNIIDSNIQNNNNINNVNSQYNDFTLLQDLSTNETGTIIDSNLDNSSQIQNSSNSYHKEPMMISSNDKREEKSKKPKQSSLSEMFSNYGQSSNLSKDMYNLDNSNIINLNNEILKGFFGEYHYKLYNYNQLSENYDLYNEIQIFEKTISKENNTKVIKIEHEFDKKINSKDYCCKTILKENITKELTAFEKDDINKFLNYNDNNKIYTISIDKKKIKFTITLEDENNNHCVFPISLYDKKSGKEIYLNIFIFSITITD